MQERGRDIGDDRRRRSAAIALAAGYSWWRQSRAAKANAVLAEALAVEEAPVVAPTAPSARQPAPGATGRNVPDGAGAREAALPKLLEAADKYPNTMPASPPRRAAGVLAAVGRYAEAEQRYREVMDKAGAASTAARRGSGSPTCSVSKGSTTRRSRSLRKSTTDPKSQLPVDGVLMQLGRAYMKAGKKNEAAHAFTRVVEEFPQSLYAADARREMEEAKKS